MTHLLKKMHEDTATDPDATDPNSADAAAADVVVIPAPPPAIEKPWTIAFVGQDCPGPHPTCTRPYGHRGHHNGSYVAGKVCSTIYPYSPLERHAWLSIHVTLSSGKVVIVTPVDLRSPVVPGLPEAGYKFLSEVKDFIFGDGSPMLRLWLASLLAPDSESVGPRSRIVHALNGCFKHPDNITPFEALAALRENCLKLAWPAPGFVA